VVVVVVAERGGRGRGDAGQAGERRDGDRYIRDQRIDTDIGAKTVYLLLALSIP
jgi:hypothetical protein